MTQEFKNCRTITNDDSYVLARVRGRADDLAQEIKIIQQCAVLTETQYELLREATFEMRKALLALDQHMHVNQWGEV